MGPPRPRSPLLLVVLLSFVHSHWSDELDLPRELLEYTIRNDASLKQRCLEDKECPFDAETLSNGRCWGYEDGCAFEKSYSRRHANCNLPTRRWKGTDKEYQKQRFFDQGDFGYLRSEGRNRMHDLCISKHKDRTRLACSDHLAYCTGENFYFDFRHLHAKSSWRYRDDVIQAGDVGGDCETFYKEALDMNNDRKSHLQSWGHELAHFHSYEGFRVDDAHCDVIFERPTVIMKLDASISMFHHFCDFTNLYASQHINGSHFDLDIDIVWWDTHPHGFTDAYFGTTWSAFTKNKPVELIALDGKKVCFKKAMLPLLARQIFGMYYNMPVMDGCQGSGLIHAFAHHVLHRLQVPQRGPLLDTVRVTVLSRSTQFRRIVNIDELMERLHTLAGIEVRLVDYNGKVPFLDQLDSTHNSDVFIGMHGSGLTHLLFLPDWAAIFEIYNCEDELCYQDLARLRGVRYQTWQNDSLLTIHGEGKHPTQGTHHAKFTNYSFDVDEFERLVQQLVDMVRRHPQFVAEQRKLRRKAKEENAGRGEQKIEGKSEL